MGILSWILFGLIMGTSAKFVLPGRDPGGTRFTMVLAAVGAIVGGLIGTACGFGPMTEFSFRSMLLAMFGAIAALFVFRLYADRAAA